MITDIISDLLSDAAIPLVMLICIRIIFDKKLSFRQYVLVFVTVQLLVMVEHWALRYTYSNDLRGFLVFYFTAFLESATAFAIFAYVCKRDILSRDYLIYALYMQVLNGIVGYLCGLSDELAYALKAHIILRESAPIIPIFIIAILHGTVGFLLSIPIRKFTLNKQRFDTGMYRWIVVVFFCLITIMGTIRHGYYNVLARQENGGDVTQVVLITSMTFVIIIIIINALIYFVNMLEIRRMKREQRETEKWIGSLRKQYLSIYEENRKIHKVLKNNGRNRFEPEDTLGENLLQKEGVLEDILQNNVSLTGNLMLDTLFTYYSHLAKEKNVEFEIQSELTGGEVKKYDQFYINAGTKLVEAVIKDEGEKKEETSLSLEDARLMNQVDMVTISDGVLSVYFEEVEEKEGYIFVSMKLGGGKLMLDYELNKALDIHKLSFGACRQYKKLKPVRRIVHLKNGIASCVSKEGRQKISVMFVQEGSK